MELVKLLSFVFDTFDFRILLPPTIKEFLRRGRIKKAFNKWSADVDDNQRKLDESVANDKNFKWTHLMWQEISMWIQVGDQVKVEDFEWLCNRRGFDYPMRAYLIDIMTHVGLGNNLSYELVPGYEQELCNE